MNASVQLTIQKCVNIFPTTKMWQNELVDAVGKYLCGIFECRTHLACKKCSCKVGFCRGKNELFWFLLESYNIEQQHSQNFYKGVFQRKLEESIEQKCLEIPVVCRNSSPLVTWDWITDKVDCVAVLKGKKKAHFPIQSKPIQSAEKHNIFFFENSNCARYWCGGNHNISKKEAGQFTITVNIASEFE